MSKGWTLTLFSLIVLIQFVLFQFDSDTRRRIRQVESNQQEIQLQFQSLTRTVLNQGTGERLTAVQQTQDSIIEEFRQHRTQVVQLLELLISKDERFEKELALYKKENGFRAEGAETDSAQTEAVSTPTQ